MLWKGGQLTRVKRETKPESVFSGKHMDNVPKETHVVSVMTLQPLETRAERRKVRLSSPAFLSKAKQTDGEEQKSSQRFSQ